ncbi:MAG TPA: hypothetical protein VLH18_04605, partial [Candidatus Limnocylindrales bacterium]|nr:hypothetical protein [Candidatus Limnocylindrales bacterium]
MIVQRIATAKAVGKLLFHDVTKIEKDVFKGPLFKKGHCIREEDIPLLLDLGKKYIYAIELEEGDLHEDDAGLRIARAVQGCGLAMQGPSEGRFNLIAESRGLLKIDVEKLEHLNQLDHIVVSTLHNNVQVEKGEKVAGAKVIPLVVSEDIINKVESICSTGPVISITPYQKLKMGLLITGHEVAEGRIRDGFAPVLQEKASFY